MPSSSISHSIDSRFWPRVRKSEGCWQWLGSCTSEGYGSFWLDGRNRHAHRLSYELLVGAIPEHRQLDHLCRNRSCVNPAHLEVVTRRTNIVRGESPAATRARQTHCIHGHRFDLFNTEFHQNGTRHCKACRNQRKRDARLLEGDCG